jgi:hypothetical protein
VGTKTHEVGASFEGTLSEAVYVDGKEAIPAGARVTGKVVESLSPGRVKGRARLGLAVDGVAVNGQTVDVVTETFIAVGKDERKKDAGVIAGGAAAGAVIGGLLGGKDDILKGAAIGGAAGTGTALATKGDDIHYPAGSRLSFRLRTPTEMTVR